MQRASTWALGLDSGGTSQLKSETHGKGVLEGLGQGSNVQVEELRTAWMSLIAGARA